MTSRSAIRAPRRSPTLTDARMRDDGREVGAAYVTTSWDDGHVDDQVIADLLDRYRLPGTFYIAPRNLELAPKDRLPPVAVADLASEFEIGGHTLTHVRLTELTDDAAAGEIGSGKASLEDCTGRPVTSFCYPGGRWRRRHARMVRDAGFVLARTTERHVTGLPGSLYATGTTFHAYRHLLDPLPAWRSSEAKPQDAARRFTRWDDWAIAVFDQVLAFGGIYHLWGHSWEVVARGDLTRLERVLAHVAGRDDVHYVTNGALAALGTRRVA
jgi:hypothetical protein